MNDQKQFYTYDGATYVGLVVATDEQFAETGYVAGAKPASFITSAMIKAEAHHRILAVLPEWKQRNLTAQAVIFAEKGRANWSDAERAAWDAGAALWEQIAALRTASDRIEAMDPIPQDYAEDRHWGTGEEAEDVPESGAGAEPDDEDTP